MCTGTCSRGVGAALWPLALLAIVANILLAFPDWKTEYVHDWGRRLTPEVLYLGGLVGGGIMIQATGRRGCCGNRCGMFLSVLSAAVGVAGALYALTVSMLGLVHGPYCQYRNGTVLAWGRPFEDHEEPSSKPTTDDSVETRARLLSKPPSCGSSYPLIMRTHTVAASLGSPFFVQKLFSQLSNPDNGFP
ncbi:hypothetical protein JRQ81_004648 [Phrynocephalus forsythii]|uniref:Uncharacterized protein n=1 Tax=Phrynocephalus forsythii TaxID=171643 RepID=A0A9Q0XFU7_9SAUR|nr:hypothetical protein JRQ81_004648 [Phrynocephalus forsythii]